LAGSKFRLTCVETLRDIHDYIRTKLDSDYQRRRRSSGVHTSSNFALEMRNGIQNQRRSISVPQTYTYQLSNTSKRPSRETILGSQSNSRRPSRGVFNVQDL
jgi:hypothetical protein